ncbi:MAG: rhombosortase [Gammaproteobacteria bacterium]|nr:rhombosortase [Gammaproteobacteria bacterium]
METRACRRSGLGVRSARFLVGTATAAAGFLVASPWLDALAFDRSLVLTGEYWRLGTSHLTHLDTRHALMNAAGTGLVAAVLLEYLRPGTVLWGALAIAAAISATSVLLSVESSYAGFSGVLHGLAALAAVVLAKRAPWLAATVGVVLIAGVLTALAGWSRPWMASVAIHTHVCGIGAGAAIGFWLRRAR